MILEQIMTDKVISLSPTATILEAHQLMRNKKIRSIPILDDSETLVGLVTERDIKNATPTFIDEKMLEKQNAMKLSAIMTKDVITGHPHDFVEDAAALFYHHKISCLPVMRRGKLVGIITGSDLLHTFIRLTGSDQPGSQIEIKVHDRPGILYEVTGILNKYQINIHSVLIYPDTEHSEMKILVFRVDTIHPHRIIQRLKDEGLDVQWPNTLGLKND